MGNDSAAKQFFRRIRFIYFKMIDCPRNTRNKRKLKQKKFLSLFFVFFVYFAGNIFAQTPEQIEYFQNQIQNGNSEAKRAALFQIRNYRTASASRTAVPALQDSDETVRATAAYSVIFLPENEAVQVLTPLLKDKSELVRKEGAYALGEARSPLAVNFLLQTLTRDKKIEVRDAAAIALGEIGDLSAVDFLVKILQKKPKESEEFLRRSAARSIGQIAQKVQALDVQQATPEDFLPAEYDGFVFPRYSRLSEFVPVFRQANAVLVKVLLSEKEYLDTKREAAFALGEIGEESSLPVLQGNLSKEDGFYLAEIAERAVRQINFLIEYRKLLESREK